MSSLAIVAAVGLGSGFLSRVHAEVLCASRNANIEASTPSSEFLIHSNGTVTHQRTGLVWMRCSLGEEWVGDSCLGTPSSFTWRGALEAVGEFNRENYTGVSGWRLPSKNELYSIIEESCYGPAINQKLFPGIVGNPSSYWSSSPSAVLDNFAWLVSFLNGGVTHQGTWACCYPIRLVRGGG